MQTLPVATNATHPAPQPAPQVRGPDRIDFSVLPSGKVLISKYDRRDGRDHPREPKTLLQFDLDGSLAWLEAHGYVVYRWPAEAGFLAGARAFRGKPWPIRTTEQLWRKREQVNRAVAEWLRKHPGAPSGVTFLDLAFCL